MRRFFSFLTITLLWLNAYAGTINQTLDIKLPEAGTGAVFQLSKQNPQLTLLSFWSADCEPCLKDMAELSIFAQQHVDVRMVGISVSDKKTTIEIWQKNKLPFPTLVNNGFPGELLRKFGNSLVAVPYTVMLTPDRILCWSVMGQITVEQLQQGLQACRMQP
jgi:peroxiredoxin